jgi:hypothetical protein
VSSLTSFGSAGGEALQGHSKVLAILHRGAKRAILTRVKVIYGFKIKNFPMSIAVAIYKMHQDRRLKGIFDC